MPRLSLPISIFAVHACEGRDKPESRICNLQPPKCIDERRILQVAVRVEQNNLMAKLFLGRISEHAQKRRDADPAGEEDGWPGCVVMEAERNHRPPIFTVLPIGRVDMTRLKAVPRTRVVSKSSSSN